MPSGLCIATSIDGNVQFEPKTIRFVSWTTTIRRFYERPFQATALGDAMYQEHWGFDRPPFQVGQDGAGYFRSPAQVEALARLTYLVNDQQRLGVLIGPGGVGKTVLLDAFARRQRLRGHQVCYRSLLGLQHDEFVLAVASDLGETPSSFDTLGILWRNIEDRLLVNRYQRLPTVFLFDDADEAESDILTAIARLAQWKGASDSRVTVVVACDQDHVQLLGSRLIDLCDLRIELHPWEAGDTAAFVRDVCLRAGRNKPVFDETGLEQLHALAQGLPRQIRQIAELALIAGTADDLKAIDGETVEDVVAEFSISDAERSWPIQTRLA